MTEFNFQTVDDFLVSAKDSGYKCYVYLERDDGSGFTCGCLGNVKASDEFFYKRAIKDIINLGQLEVSVITRE